MNLCYLSASLVRISCTNVFFWRGINKRIYFKNVQMILFAAFSHSDVEIVHCTVFQAMQAIGSHDRRSASHGSRLNVWAGEGAAGERGALGGAGGARRRRRPGGCTPCCRRTARRGCQSRPPDSAAAPASCCCGGGAGCSSRPPRVPCCSAAAASIRSITQMLVRFTKKLNNSHVRFVTDDRPIYYINALALRRSGRHGHASLSRPSISWVDGLGCP